ncbi:MAG: hypothetical protein U1E67_17230 [Hyphomicrobiales bacterium]
MISVNILKRRWKLVFGFAVAVAAFSSSSFAPAYAQSADDADFHISAVAEFYADHVYSKKPGHKALAVGPGGYWADNTGQSTASKAENTALNACNAALRTSPFKSLSKQQCVIFDLDGKRTGSASPVGIPFGTIPSEPDYPLLTARKYIPEGTARGTLVFLHGCNRQGDSGWLYAWGSFYQAAGFRVLFPNSFAEDRDPELCGSPGEKGIDQQTRILKQRIAQTKRSLAILRKQFPGEPIYLHGQSEGGYVVQALGEDVAGIIVTGSACGFGDGRAYSTPAKVPTLIVAGTKDPFFNQARSQKSLSAYCKNAKGGGPLKAVSIRGMGHYAAPWWPGMTEAIGEFLKIPALKIRPNPDNSIAPPQLSDDFLTVYKKQPLHKGVAVSSDGTWGTEFGYETALDAREATLFRCDSFEKWNPYAEATHTHKCVISNLDGKSLK